MTTENNNNSDRTSTTSNNASNTLLANQTAALRGATLAFGKPPVKSKTKVQIPAGRDGALAAATKAGRPSASRSVSVTNTGSIEETRLRPQQSGRGVYSPVRGTPGPGTVQLSSSSFVSAGASGHLKVPRGSSDRSTSPSFIAAALAASRSSPMSPNHSGQSSRSPPHPIQKLPSPSRRSPAATHMNKSWDVPEDALDTSSIPPTTALIGIFEKSGSKPMVQSSNPAIVATASRPPEIISPKPIRAQSLSIKSDTVIPSKPPPASTLYQNSSSTQATPTKKQIPPKRISDENDISSSDSFVSASEARPIPIPPPVSRQRPVSVSPSINSMTVDSLANAIVASSLASSRTASPIKNSLNTAPPLPPPRRGKKGLFHHHDTRTPSPTKGFRQTMRKPKEEEDEDRNMMRMGKKHLMKKHPNKHHEGDRKRWRDSITERERKRYEAVWASNKGLFISDSTPSFSIPQGGGSPQHQDLERASNCVLNVVVRDIWSRSRLGNDVLTEVWELVDRTGTGKLSREEFVTGLWLIDQRLKGRKLPIRVSPSVWASAGASIGVKVKGNGRKHSR